ncbi:uncharacterized protein EI97DRAFT_448535 [Westerdykella ornata]|uniref:DUF4604 domain-containing protein n=1 Tax=Westerdykella ornata TaxID=318751 RepID=A0A6A6JPW8_WESOR|nr:uncharacterized protein EI97DRAFT_448535 [Westerdykella ornata]KAF2278661.1 hypothetical protein EI97DRAFT_448535 [Westerdykella ornata]
MGFKAKDLTYDAAQPAFLQRLRGQIAGDGSARPEPSIPRNKKLVRDDEDDAPTYVLEGTNQSLTKAEYEALVAGKDADAAEDSAPTTIEHKDAPSQPKEKIAEVGKGSKKRKAAKVIGGDEEDDDAGKDEAKVVKKAKKKAKPVKLSFGDQEDGG